jgi:integrase
MPRRSSGPRLWQDKSRNSWTIVDGNKRIRTGYPLGEDSAAQKALAEYIAKNHRPDGDPNPKICDVILAYQMDHVEGLPSEDSISNDLVRLGKWWGDKRASDITADNVKKYTKHRGGKTTVRRELGFLETALRHWSKNYHPIRVPTIKRPEKPLPRQRWLTIPEAAKFLRHIRRQADCEHIARFFLLGWYTGSRATVIMKLQWDQIDLKAGLLYRQRPGTTQTKKRAPPVRIGRRLIGHLRRWRRISPDSKYVVEYRGKSVERVAKGWNKARTESKLHDVHPHVLRHSRATHLLRQRVDPYEAAESLGMSITVFQKTYGHHHPDWQHTAADAR